jgi:hypothetical protein
VGSDQCGVALAKRSGKWLCMQPAPGANAVRATATTGWCNMSGCYNRYSDLLADYSSNYAYWGYGATTLGHAKFYVEWTLQGAQTISKPVYYWNSVATDNVVITGDLINAAPGAVGQEVPGAWNLYNAGNVPAYTNIAWNPNGYKSYDNHNWDHSQVHQWSWNYPGYSGYWYAYVKSICSHTTNKAIYRFDAASQEPANPWGSGYHRDRSRSTALPRLSTERSVFRSAIGRAACQGRI